MRIIIVGCGKVGQTLVEQLSKENHELVVIDVNPDKFEQVEDSDAMCIAGNGNSYQTLLEAGVKKAHLLIAVTGSDEQNLLCCLIARKTGKCQTIARVRNPVYSKEVEFLKKEFGLAMIINPEWAAADEMARIFQFPSAIKIDRVAHGMVELLHFRITADSPLNGQQVIDVRNKYNQNVLICSVTREDQVTIPGGDFIFRENDTVSVVARRYDAMDFFRKLGLMTGRVRNVLIAGGGKISYYLTASLLKAGIHTTIIEMDKNRCEYLAEMLPQATIIYGDATDEKLLDQEGVEHAEGFAALTGLDEENILLALYTKAVSKAKIITKINRIGFSSVIGNLDLDCVINPRIIMADSIVRYVRASRNSDDSDVENLYKLEEGKAEAVEFIVKENSPVTDVPLHELKIRKNTLIASIVRDGKIIIPSGQDKIQVNDSVIVVLAGYSISDLKGILEQ